MRFSSSRFLRLLIFLPLFVRVYPSRLIFVLRLSLSLWLVAVDWILVTIFFHWTSILSAALIAYNIYGLISLVSVLALYCFFFWRGGGTGDRVERGKSALGVS